MSLTIKKEEGGDFELLPAGTHAAVCIRIIDFGPQITEYNGETKDQNKMRLQFEVPAERITWTDKEGVESEGPMTIGKTYTASMFKMATLRQHLEAWRGKAFTEVEEMGFDIKNVLGKPCMIGVQHKEYNGREYAAITSISPIMKGMEVKAENPLVAFDFDLHTPEELAALPEWMRDKIGDGKKLTETQEARVGEGGYGGGGFREDENPKPLVIDDEKIPF